MAGPLAEYVRLIRWGIHLPPAEKPEPVVDVGLHQEWDDHCREVVLNELYDEFEDDCPAREPMRLPDSPARYRKMPPRCGACRPRYKNPRRGGSRFRKHLRRRVPA